MKAPIGYRSTVYGDESTPLIEVFELDEDEKLLQALISQAKMAQRPLRVSHGSKPSPTQIGKLAELEAVVDQLHAQCRHRVFYDEAGFLYSLRSCVTCGAHMGSV